MASRARPGAIETRTEVETSSEFVLRRLGDAARRPACHLRRSDSPATDPGGHDAGHGRPDRALEHRPFHSGAGARQPAVRAQE